MYPEYNQLDPDNPKCSEDSLTLPLLTASTDGKNCSANAFISLLYEKLWHGSARSSFPQHLRTAGHLGWRTGKAPLLCRKIAMAEDNGEIEIWGDGMQTRSFPLHRRMPGWRPPPDGI